ncbi:cytochrome c oxidase subunit 1 [Globomyces sp. JEL0801]|nr:cytochrome c oxidase subunit 1 [Globomyces sp. JEL0801]
MIVTGSYLDKAPPVAGSVRTSLRMPPNLPVPSYCTPGPFNPDGCLFWSPEQIAYPFIGELNTLFITTRVSIYNASAKPDCSFLSPTSQACTPPSISELRSTRKTYYIANVEAMTMQIDHSVRTQGSFKFGQSIFTVVPAKNMIGTLQNVCPEKAPIVYENPFDQNYRESKPFNTSLDVIPLQKFLDYSTCESETFDFNVESNADGAASKETVRSAGFIVSVPINYANRQSNNAQLKYQYLPSIIGGSEMKLTQQQFNSDGSITYLDRHGIRLVFAQTGSIVLNLVAALAMVKVATLIVDSMMLYLLPKKETYKKAKFDETEDLHHP